MSGPATFGGTNYQAKVIAYVYVHVLSQRRLGWLDNVNDAPLAVWSETGGPGDDARIEFGERHDDVELQAKHGLQGGQRLREALAVIAERGSLQPSDVLLVVDPTTSGVVRRDFARDLDRLRTGRHDGLRAETIAVEQSLGPSVGYLQRIHVRTADVDDLAGAHAQTALEILRGILVDESQAPVAWELLVRDAAELAARRQRRDAKDLTDLLAAANIAVKPLSRDARLHTELDHARRLLEAHLPAAALTVLREVEAHIDERTDLRVRYRLDQQRAAALLQQDRYGDSLAAARRALDFRIGCRALAVAALASMFLGDLATAKAYASRATDAHRSSERAWAVAAEVAFASGEELPTPPPGVASSAHFRTVLAELYVRRSDWAVAGELTGNLLAEGVRKPEVLIVQAYSMFESPNADDVGRRERLENVERLTTEAIDLLPYDEHPLMSRALLLRSTALRELGREEEANRNITLAQQRGAADDPDTLRHAASARALQGDHAGAYRILQNPIVDSDALLLALRAGAALGIGDRAAAKADLDKALGLIGGSAVPDAVRLIVAEASLELGDTEVAAQLLANVERAAVEPAHIGVLEGRLALAEGRHEDGILLFREAADAAGNDRGRLLGELGTRLLKADRPSEAAEVFTLAGDQLPDGYTEPRAGALYAMNDLVSADAVVRQAIAQPDPPAWAFAMAANIAVRQDNETEVVRHLTELIERDVATPDARIQLVRFLIELERIDDALPRLGELRELDEAAPVQLMQIAELHRMAGLEEQALNLAFSAYRLARQDPRIQRAFATLVMTSKHRVPIPTEVVAGSHVSLRDEHGSLHEFTLLDDDPDQSRNEITSEAADALGLIGKRVGEQVVRGGGQWAAEWTVVEILPAILYEARQVMNAYSERFPTEPFFVKGVHVGNDNDPRAFGPLMAVLNERRAHVEATLGLYREQVLPLGLIAKLTGHPIATSMEAIAASVPPLFVEWGNPEGRQESVDTAREAKAAILTRSGLKTAGDIGFLDKLVAELDLIAPLSLQRQLRKDIADAEQRLAEGDISIAAAAEIGIRMDEIPPGDPRLEQSLNILRSLAAWLDEHATIEPRPLGSVGEPGSRTEEVRDLVGADSYDAVALALAHEVPVYADDLGLRKLALNDETRPPSVSTVALLHGLAERAALDPKERDKHLIALVLRGYAFVSPSSTMLQAAMEHPTPLPATELSQVFATLTTPGTTASEAAAIGVHAAREVAISALQTVSLSSAIDLVLTAMGQTWPPGLVARLVNDAAEREFRFLPSELAAARGRIKAFLLRSVSLGPGGG